MGRNGEKFQISAVSSLLNWGLFPKGRLAAFPWIRGVNQATRRSENGQGM